jgi:hypothetical protein
MLERFSMISSHLRKIVIGISLFALSSAGAFAPTNFFPPYDPALRLPHAPFGDPLRIGVNVECGSTDQCRNWDGKKENVLRIYECSQSTIAMLENPTCCVQSEELSAIQNNLRVAGGAWRVGGVGGGGVWDDGNRGHILLSGDFAQLDVTPHIRWVLPGKDLPGRFALSVSLPIRYAHLHNVRHCDLTGSGKEGVLPAWDQAVKDILTSDIENIAKRLGCIDWSDWDATGLGDLVVMFDWWKVFAQNRDSLKDVELHALFGLSCPTGLEKDENKAFSFAFGNDGAWSIPFGIGLDLIFDFHIILGLDAQFEVILDDSKDRRMKTHPYQTEFLLLNKGRATKEHGLTWKFYLYLQAFHFWRGLSLKAAYEYLKHDNDRLSPKTDDFNANIANSARSLEEWNTHNAIFSLNYDFFEEFKRVKPQLSLFYKLPLTGKKVIMPYTFGGQLAFNF